MRLSESTPTGRAGYIGVLLGSGKKLTTREVADMTGLTMRGVQIMLEKISLDAPIYRDDDGRWMILVSKPVDDTTISPY
jgi:hypothetical protein